MSAARSLAGLLEHSAQAFPDKVAVTIPGGRSVTYAELSTLSDRLRDRLVHMGVGRGDRVGLRLHKSIESVATIFGALKAGAAYVPVDAESPAARAAYILKDCDVKVVVTERDLEPELVGALGSAAPRMLVLDAQASCPMEELLDQLQRSDPAPPVASISTSAEDIAYILYTSGSTGNPKGVVLSHGNALSFIDWCSETFAPCAEDRFSSHAPFHFDLSILDIYVSLKHGATLVLIGEALGKEPMKLAATIAAERISVWYSTPSILSLLANYGKLTKYDFGSLRMVFFAGEVFPIPQYRALHAVWTTPRCVNLYGPTETNVCTWYEVTPDAPLDRMSTFPIGKICPPNRGMVVDEQGDRVCTGQSGELLVSGPNVMLGYWNLPEQNARAFFIDQRGERWYRTGDIVSEEADVGYRYVGRRDRMIKRRGYRVELGEVEAALLRHPAIREAAVVATSNVESGVRIQAFVACQTGMMLTRIALKTYSAQALPPYMIPDVFEIVPALPRTSTDKIDYQRLKSVA